MDVEKKTEEKLAETSKIPLQPIDEQVQTGLNLGVKTKSKKSHKKLLLFIIGGFVLGLIITGMSVFAWFNLETSPLDKNGSSKVITIGNGSSPKLIAAQLRTESIIKNSFAFELYVRINRQGNFLQAGSYRLSPAMNVSEIVSKLVKGSVETLDITFFPGATLVDNTNKTDSKKLDITTVLRRAGYSNSEINNALAASYDGPLFAGKPASADLEGYVMGETYKFSIGASVKDILSRIFDDFYKEIQTRGLIEKFNKENLTLYQAITLASIIQREDADASTQKQVAQVFFTRMKAGMTLGSDVTYQYIADKLGLTRDPGLDNPYNTRKYAGLPPGPIAVPGISALEAVANPASGDYLYFLSGDDDKMYFAKTNAEHEANIENHCAIKCSTP